MSLKIDYQEVLKRYLSENREVDLMRAYELGKNFQQQQISPDELVGMHLEAIESLPESLSDADRLKETMASFNVLIETMIAYGIAYADAYRLLETTAREIEEAKYELERIIVELDLANQQMQDVDRLKTQFFSNMSHELRTPLNSIIGFAEDALDGLAGPLTPKQARYVQNILQAGRHLLTVINEILDLAKLRSGKSTLELSVFSLQDVLDEVERTFQPLVERKKQTLVILSDQGIPPLKADRAKVFQILVNLVSNAHKYTPEGGAIRITSGVVNGSVQIVVRDTGTGIPKDALLHLFEEFRQVDAMRKSRQQGTGLGLAITKQLVEMHGGTIQVESEVDLGSTFIVTLPLEVQE